MSQAILNNAKICNAATVMVTPILQDLPRLSKIVDASVKRLREAAKIAIRFADFHGLPYYKPVAGLYIWLRLSHDCNTSSEEESLVQNCAKQGVLVGSGADYAEPEAGWFRLTFALPEQDFLEGLRRIEEAMDYKKKFNYVPTRTSRGVTIARGATIARGVTTVPRSLAKKASMTLVNGWHMQRLVSR
jgi:gliotoxin/aspirochlorine biosynthesis aminotransferase